MFVRQVHGESQFDAKQDVIKAWNGSNMIINISLHSVPKTCQVNDNHGKSHFASCAPQHPASAKAGR